MMTHGATCLHMSTGYAPIAAALRAADKTGIESSCCKAFDLLLLLVSPVSEALHEALFAL